MIRHGIAVSLLLLAGCNSVLRPLVKIAPDYADLPADTLRQVATEIETSVQNGDRDAKIENREGITVQTDEIQQAIRTRAARSALINGFRDSGHVWETRNGLITILRTKDYKHTGTRKDRDRNALLIMGENADRWTIYEGVVKASHLPPRSLSAVQREFHEARVSQLRAGQKYENEAGEMATK
ncbi:MAG: DUF1318 domain-containing protein [Candidatus Hydrogenedentes bacterium]|nr:DUF1318 domain-containing protein [Candidatus Hydrogenedentota bacterium]